MTQIHIQRHILILFTIAMILFLTVSLASCAFDESENNYRGGELIDDEKMSEIKNELLGAGNDTFNDHDTSLKPDWGGVLRIFRRVGTSVVSSSLATAWAISSTWS